MALLTMTLLQARVSWIEPDPRRIEESENYGLFRRLDRRSQQDIPHP